MTQKITVEISNQQDGMVIDHDQIEQAVTEVLLGESIATAEINVAIVDNAQIHETNRQFLNHDYPTDVITFPWDEPDSFGGDIMVSAEMATEVSSEYNWSPMDELRLYVIHGVLHLAGYDDHSDDDRAAMRQRETKYLSAVGIDVSRRKNDAMLTKGMPSKGDHA